MYCYSTHTGPITAKYQTVYLQHALCHVKIEFFYFESHHFQDAFRITSLNTLPHKNIHKKQDEDNKS